MIELLLQPLVHQVPDSRGMGVQLLAELLPQVTILGIGVTCGAIPAPVRRGAVAKHHLPSGSGRGHNPRVLHALQLALFMHRW